MGELLRTMRERRGLRAAWVADQLAISPSTLNRIETGRTEPSLLRLAAILDLYGASDDERSAVLSAGMAKR